MENLSIEKTEITWERTKKKHGSIITYKNTILRHDNHPYKIAFVLTLQIQYSK